MPEKPEVCLEYLPMGDVVMPSLGLSLLAADLKQRGIGVAVEYGNLRFAAQLGLKEYYKINSVTYILMYGEYIFKQAAHGGKSDDGAYVDWLRGKRGDYFGRFEFQDDGTAKYIPGDRQVMLDKFAALKNEAERFVKLEAERILAHEPVIVGISSMFQQNNAMLAVAKRIKELRPETIIAVGGSNCFDTAGAALLEYFPQIDYVFQGEADESFGQLCEQLLSGRRPTGTELPYGVIDRGSGRCEHIHSLTLNLERLPYPDFTDYFRTAEELFGGKLLTKLIIEGSRGCWWGEKHTCTFCGLNGEAVRYRAKSSGRLAAEIKYFAGKYPQARECVFADCILSNDQAKELPELLQDMPQALSFFTEIKANATLDSLRRLKAVGFTEYQPGIESLNDHVLQLMNKGCRAIKQVETLKNYSRLGLWFVWNLLCGFPGETEADYEELAELLPKLTHFTPPSAMIHIAYHRSSVYEREREKYGLKLRPAAQYRFILPPNEDLAERLAYMFEPVDAEECAAYDDCQLMGKAYKKVWDITTGWKLKSLSCRDRLDKAKRPDGIEIYDMRSAAEQLYYKLTGLRARVFELADEVISRRRVYELLESFPAAEIDEAIEYLKEQNLLIEINGELLSLAVEKEA